MKLTLELKLSKQTMREFIIILTEEMAKGVNKRSSAAKKGWETRRKSLK